MAREVLKLSESDRLKLENGYQYGLTSRYRTRCKAVLLFSEGYSPLNIANILNVSNPSVYKWIKRYEVEGINGLRTRSGQGRRPIMDCSDEEAVRKAIEEDRQRLVKHGKMLLVKKPVI